jgi:DNA repair exonuclease SbcCD ATPase subunit
MRLLNLKLQSWRGIASREVTFSKGVTLIEGPNEIGKSTIVEAIRLLFSELDSSKKQAVRSIKPVDQDVGSTVEVEMMSGDFHFVYSKTFNKSSQTSLNVLAPKKRQVTGREAHEVVEQMLAETVDMALWEALLIDQGEKVALANVQDSAGLTRALDDAAGVSASGGDDTDLYEAAQAEYERYFTLKSGKARFSDAEAAFDAAQESLDAANQALGEVEQTALDHERRAAEVLRIKSELPRLQEIANEHEKISQAVKALEEEVNSKQSELSRATEIQQAAIEAQKQRHALIAEVSKSKDEIAAAREQRKPLAGKVEIHSKQIDAARQSIADLRKGVKEAKAELDLALADEQHLKNSESLNKAQDRLKQLRAVAEEIASELKIVNSTKVDELAIEKIRDADNRVAIARGTRNTAATQIAITAERELTVEIDGEGTSLGSSETESRSIAGKLTLRIPGVAAIEVTPPLSAVERQAEVEEAEEELARLLRQFKVADLKDAMAANERRANAQRNVDGLKARETEILAGKNTAEIVQEAESLDAEIMRYADGRKASSALPEGLMQAARDVADARARLESNETALEAAQDQVDASLAEHAELDQQLRGQEQQLAGLEATSEEKEQQLKKSRASLDDAAIAQSVEKAALGVEKLEAEAGQLRARLKESSPESVEALLSNARDALERAKSDLRHDEQLLAVLADRLQQSQADGRYDTKERAEREFEEAQATLEAIIRRARAAELLWNTLNRFRDAARKAYVQPLKVAIERLGKIAFGPEFEIEIADDWTVLSRTMNGITLPFVDLSVGVKEQIGILARLAVAQIVAKQGGVPLIIDDALGFSDPGRLESIGAAITAAGKESQIIILTCTPGRFSHVGSAEVVRL